MERTRPRSVSQKAPLGTAAARAAALLALLAAVFAGDASAHSDPCHPRHTCPSDHHTYLWQGLSCTSYADERLSGDRTKVVVGGRTYWCHRGQAEPAGPEPSPRPNGGVAPRPPVVTAAAATRMLSRLPVRATGSMAGYSRARFGAAWADVDGNRCDTRDDILRRDLTAVRYRPGSACVVAGGTLRDPYTGRRIVFVRGVATSGAVQIDHVVALGNAWRTGAAAWPASERLRYANDPSVLLAVDGPANEAKGDDDASGWLPPNLSYDCRYVEQQITIKTKYKLWVTTGERNALRSTLARCR